MSDNHPFSVRLRMSEFKIFSRDKYEGFSATDMYLVTYRI